MAGSYPPASRSGMPGWAWAIIGCGCLGLLVFGVGLPAILFPVFVQARAKARETVCMANVRQLGTSALMYMQDYDEVLPSARSWCDTLRPYTMDEKLFHCPEVGKGNSARYGYAFDERVSKKLLKKIPSPGTTPLLYESTNLERNAMGRFNDLPTPGRHQGRNVVGYVDGHTKAIGSGDVTP